MFCPNCGKLLPDESCYCPECGAEFSDEEEVIEIIPEKTEYSRQPDSRVKGGGKGKKTAVALICALSVILAAVIVAAAIGSGKIGFSKETVTDAEGEKIRGGFGTVEMAVRDADGTLRTIRADRKLLTAENILVEYTRVMDKLKTDAPGFTSVRYQNLPVEHQNLGGLGRMILPIIEQNVTAKNVVTPDVTAAGNAQKLPLRNSAKGCLLNDVSKIKTAYCEVLEDGEKKIVITLADEMNPVPLSAGAETSDGTVNAVFDPYVAPEMINAISTTVSGGIDFNYTDCTVTLIYNDKTDKVSSVNMTMNIDISFDILVKTLNVRITDITELTDFGYAN